MSLHIWRRLMLICLLIYLPSCATAPKLKPVNICLLNEGKFMCLMGAIDEQKFKDSIVVSPDIPSE